MDSEKSLDIQKKLRKGLSPNDEGPFYHHAWWESYKGSIKGKMGGALIGTLMGVVVGAAVAGAFALGVIGPGLAVLGWPVIGGILAAFTGGGLLYGAHEFSDIGKGTGTVAAGLETADARQAVRFAAIDEKLGELTTLIKGKSSADHPEKSPLTEAEEELDKYRTTHYAHVNGSSKGPIFWKVALIGLAVGALAGLALGSSHVAMELLAELGLPVKVTAALSTLTFGLFGASFGINRDVFRRIFDKTDLWSKGILSHEKVRESQLAAGKEIEDAAKAVDAEYATPKVATAVAPEGYIDYPTSSTYHRDRALANAEKALMSFDHTRATPQ